MKINKYIDHTLLKPEATAEKILALCEEAKKYEFASVCINPSYVALAAEVLAGTTVKVCTVVGFPLGATMSEVKAFEAETAIAAGADEIDMVINIGALKSKAYDLVLTDIKAVREASYGHILKVIIECALLEDAEKVIACEIAVKAGADFVKTSTGFASGGATVADVKLMKKTVGDSAKVKAAGGIRTASDAEAMIKAGASRLGTSGGVKIIQGESHKGY